jgi:sulfur relay (sulfurtransferase) DsrC/TusE family protein
MLNKHKNVTDLTEQEKYLCKFIKKYYNCFLKFPSIREICEELNYSSSRSGKILLDRLKKKKIIHKRSGKIFKIYF